MTAALSAIGNSTYGKWVVESMTGEAKLFGICSFLSFAAKLPTKTTLKRVDISFIYGISQQRLMIVNNETIVCRYIVVIVITLDQ